MKMFNLYKKLFEDKDETLFEFKPEWVPTDADWQTMIFNLNNHSNLANIFRKCTVFNIDKMVRCYKVAQVIGWPRLEQRKDNIFKLFRHTGIFYDELEIIDNQFIDLPKIWEKLILDLEQYDKLGGVALRHEDMGEFSDDIVLFNAIKHIDKDIESIKFKGFSIYRGDFNPNQRIIKFTFFNGCVAYVKVVRQGANDHYLKTYESTFNNLKRDRFATLMEIEMRPYINGEKTDPDWVPNTL